MNYPWNILEIEKTEDQKSIKRAYAKLLRNNKPDENPDGFTQLNAAFKQAIDMAAQNTHTSQAIDPALYLYKWDKSAVSSRESPLSINLEEANLEENRISKNSAHPIHLLSQETEINNVLKDKSELTDYIDKGEKYPLAEIFSLIESRNYDLSSWEMVLNNPHMLLNGRYIEQASYCIFQAILKEVENDKIHKKQSKPNKDKNVLDIIIFDSYYIMKTTFLDNNKALLLYFNDLFNWTADWKSLNIQFGNEAIHLIDEIEKIKNNIDGILDRWADKLVAKEIGPAYDIIIKVLYFMKQSLSSPPKSIKAEIIQAMVALFLVLVILVLLLIIFKSINTLLT